MSMPTRSLLVAALVFLAACGGGGGNGGTGGGEGGGTGSTGGGAGGGDGGGTGGGGGGGTGQCTDDCAVTGGSVCNGATSFQLCGQLDSDSCLDLSTTVFQCTGSQVCSNGVCAPDAGTCTDDCGQSGAVSCDGTSGTRTCGQYDSDSCLDLSAPAACPSGQQCNGGVCAPSTTCTNDCGPSGTKQCDVTNGFRTCGNYDTDTCLEWSTVTACQRTEACSGGSCTTICSDDCNTGTQTCHSGNETKTCGNYDTDPCYEYSAPAACNSNQNCVNNVCTACTNECPTSGQGQCEAGADAGFRTCGNFDTDSCFEWSSSVTFCTAGQVCYSGACSVPCTDDCTAQGKTQCSGSQVQTCGNYDGDSCLEWSTAAACTNGGTCSAGICQAANAPTVNMITPQGAVQTTQGATVNMLVDATAASGRTLARVEYYANDVKQSETTSSPHQYTYTVPTSAATNSVITLQAQAVDTQGTRGYSNFATLTVKNDLPVATFTASVAGANIVQVDASAVTDTETPKAQLEVCWDWDNNNNCDTAYSTTKVATYTFTTAGTYTIGMKVKDAVGQISQTTRSVTFQNVQFIGGVSVTTTTWYGTIVITGDITVPAGNTLTVSPGTQVLFVRQDSTPADGVGDHGLFIQGQLNVQGTAAQPVLFSSYSQTQADGGVVTPTAGSWDRIQLTGTTASTIDYAIIEYADVGLDVRNASTVSNTIVRSTRWDCISLDNADSSSFTKVSTTNCGRSGVAVSNGSTSVTFDQHLSKANGLWGFWESSSSSITVTNSTVQQNGDDGMWVGQSSTLNLSDSTVESNARAGLYFYSTSAGTVTRNQIRQNGREGVSFENDGSGAPNPVVQLNNIYSNATAGSQRWSGVNPSISASSTVYNVGTSANHNAPTGRTIRRVYVNYNEATSSTYVNGYLQDGAGNNLQTFSNDFNGWVYVPWGTTSVRVQVYDSGYSSTTDTISATWVDYVSYDGTADVVSGALTGTVDLRYNYLGTWPNVLTRVHSPRSDALNVQGFVGAAFTSSWTRDPYKAGFINTETWSGTVFVTGDITIPAGQTITVSPGTVVEFVKHDQQVDNIGDFTLFANGKLNVNGSSTSPVVFKAQGTSTGDAYQRIVLAGSGTNASAWTYANVNNGRVSLEVRASSTLANVSVNGGGGDAVQVNTGNGATFTDLIVRGGRKGVYVNASDTVSFVRPDIQNCTSDAMEFTNAATGWTIQRALLKSNAGGGLLIYSGSTGTIEDSTINNNGWAGVYVYDASPTIRYNLISYNNGAGLSFVGTTTASATYNVVKFNNDNGVAVFTGPNGNPTPTVNYSNIYGNAVMGTYTSSFANPSISASSTVYNVGTSANYTAPTGRTIRRVYVNYNEATSSTYVNGYLQDGSGNNLQTFSNDFNGWVFVPYGTTAVRVQVYDSGYSSTTDTINANNVELEGFDSAAHYELYCSSDSTAAASVNAKFNYWTANPADVPTKIYERNTSTVDYTGYTGFEYGTAGNPTPVGPRP